MSANFDYEGAIQAGYSPDEINEFLQSQIPEKTAAQKAGRVGAQLGLGMTEMEMLPYELAVAPFASFVAVEVAEVGMACLDQAFAGSSERPCSPRFR